MAELELLLQKAVEDHASDIFITAGMPLAYKAKGRLVHVMRKNYAAAVMDSW